MQESGCCFTYMYINSRPFEYWKAMADNPKGAKKVSENVTSAKLFFCTDTLVADNFGGK